MDQVIAPTVPRDTTTDIASGYMNPDAEKLLEKPHLYGLDGENSIRYDIPPYIYINLYLTKANLLM